MNTQYGTDCYNIVNANHITHCATSGLQSEYGIRIKSDIVCNGHLYVAKGEV